MAYFQCALLNFSGARFMNERYDIEISRFIYFFFDEVRMVCQILYFLS